MEILSRFFGSFLPRLDGPLHFRFILQPTMAIILAIIDGIKDAKLGRVPYFWDMVRNPERRKELFILGLKRLGKVLILAVILDVIYQIKVYHWFYPGETIAVAILLAIIPYLLVRGPVNRIFSWRKQREMQNLQIKGRS
jgi:hypothetical protein